MRKLNRLIAKTQLFLKRNSSTILTGIGVVGVVATSVMAVKATPKAMQLIEQAKEEKGEELTKFEVVNVAGPAYIPAVVMGASTIACIVGANILSRRQQASLMSAYAVLDSSYKDYKKKLKELYGEEADTEIRHEIVKDKYREEYILDEDGDELFFDSVTACLFHSTTEKVLAAENRFNKNYMLSGYASVTEYCDTLGIPRKDWSSEFGWSLDAGGAFYGYSWLDFIHEKVVTDDGIECTIITLSSEPTADYLGF